MKTFLPAAMISIMMIIITTGCTRNQIDLREQITGSDSVAINFFKGDGTMDTVVAVKILRDRNSLQKLTALITASSSKVNNNCGYDGSVHFFKNNMVVQDIDFRMGDTHCSQFSFTLKGKRAATNLSAEARGFLTELKMKQP